MAQGRPPRRSGRKSEPATIDLQAEKDGEGNGAGSGITRAGDDGVTGEGPERGSVASAAEAGKMPETESSTEVDAPSPAADAEHSGSETSSAEAGAAAAGAAVEPTEAETASSAPSEPSAEEERGADAAGRPDAAEPEERPAAAVPPPTGGGARGFAAGLVGGVIVAAIVLGLEAAGILPAPGSSQTANTASRISDLGSEVGALKASIAELKKNPPQAAANTKAVDDLQAQVKSLSDKLAGLENTARSSGTTGAAELSNLKDGLAKAGSRIDRLSSTVSGLKSDVTGVRSNLSDLKSTVESLKSDVATATRQTSLAAVVAATALKSAIERGGPFAAELKVYRHVAPNSQASQKLQDIAASGVRSHAALVDEFPDVADSILSAVRGTTASTGLFDRLVNSARSVIKVRPTGNPKGSAPSDIVARMETKLKAGNLKGVVDEWSSLPAAGQKASQSFIDQVKKRMTALEAADSALQDAMSSTEKQG